MANPRTADIKTRFEELSAGAQLDILVPTSFDFDPTTLFHDGLPGRLSSAPSRRNLYFDETTQVNLILRTSLGERAVRSLLGSLDITLGAHATDAVPQGHGNAASASGKHDLTAKTIPGTELSNVLFAGEQTYVIWKPTLHVSRPKARLQRPAVYFTANISLTTAAINSMKIGQDTLLKSFEPLPGNILEPLKFDKALDSSDIFLPDDRITKVLPASATERNELRPIRGLTKRALPIVPALYTRIRYSALPDALIASLHLEISHLMHGTISFDEVALDVGGTNVPHIASSSNSDSFLAGDESVRLYKLTPMDRNAAPSPASTVSVRMQATVDISPGSAVRLESSWQAQVDLSKVATQPTYKWSRPLSSGPLQTPSRPSTHAPNRPSSTDFDRQVTRKSGITFRFTAPAMVKAGSEFILHIHCANSSGRTLRFALVRLHSKKSHTSRHSRGSSIENADLIDSIFHPPKSEHPRPPDVLDLNPDVRIGPLSTGAVFETQMEFRAVGKGCLDLGVIRIVDLETRQTVDVRELPDIVAAGTQE